VIWPFAVLEQVMSDENREVVLEYLRALEQQDRVRLQDLVTPDVVAWGPGQRMCVRGFEDWCEATFDPAFSNESIRVDDLIAEGDRVVLRYTMQVKQMGEALGSPGSGQRIVNSGIKIYRLRDGRIAELWGEQDMIGLLGQLGVRTIPEEWISKD
jgi:predicted ester cyclase